MKLKKNNSCTSYTDDSNAFFLMAIPQEQLQAFEKISDLDNLSIMITNSELQTHLKEFNLTQKKYICKQKLGYRLLGNKSAPIDTGTTYYIKCFALACDNRPVIARCDNQAFEENRSWIVDLHNLIEIDDTYSKKDESCSIS